ncbi:MAG: endolytic transglycosylase MltG [Gemmatimonadetes bacterium]|nr:endolytic transglycosylase MltG [Gemmatimonadota bacterium]
MKRRKPGLVIGGLLAVWVGFVITGGEGESVQVTIPAGSTLPAVSEILEAHDVIGSATLFQLYTRARRGDRKLKAGTYQLATRTSMRDVLTRLTRGEVMTVAMTIPEGFQLQQMAQRIAEVTGLSNDEVRETLTDSLLEDVHSVPGPGLEGYLFPDTYRFAEAVPVDAVLDAMVARYRAVWTPQRLALLDRSGMTEREIVTLASIIQAEARHVSEMPRISGVYHNRLEAGWLLQADPTVLFALGGYRARLLYAAIDSVEDHPYNTYSQRGLPPGPIGAPGEAAIDAALSPEDHDFMYFVAWPDGSHVFTRSLAEHNRAKEDARSARTSDRS